MLDLQNPLVQFIFELPYHQAHLKGEILGNGIVLLTCRDQSNNAQHLDFVDIFDTNLVEESRCFTLGKTSVWSTPNFFPYNSDRQVLCIYKEDMNWKPQTVEKVYNFMTNESVELRRNESNLLVPNQLISNEELLLSGFNSSYTWEQQEILNWCQSLKVPRVFNTVCSMKILMTADFTCVSDSKIIGITECSMILSSVDDAEPIICPILPDMKFGFPIFNRNTRYRLQNKAELLVIVQRTAEIWSLWRLEIGDKFKWLQLADIRLKPSAILQTFYLSKTSGALTILSHKFSPKRLVEVDIFSTKVSSLAQLATFAQFPTKKVFVTRNCSGNLEINSDSLARSPA